VTRPPSSAQDNLAEYADPVLYDLENVPFEPDGPFLLDLAQRQGGPALELGCGTGRITIPLAQNGVDITGLDVVPAMVARARHKAGDLPIRWVVADARGFHLGQLFQLIFETGSVFQHVLERSDQEAYLACVRRHLAPGGLFVVGVMFPHPGQLASVEAEQEWFSYDGPEGQEVRVSGTEAYDPLRQVKLETAIRRIASPDGNETVHVAPLRLRYTFPQEMEALLDRSGFEVKERYGGPDRSPLTGESRFMVSVCTNKGF
jgi:SAM-dependent methyltransferase